MLTPYLSYDTQLKREIYIPNVPPEIFKKADASITLEIETENNIILTKMQKFDPETTKKNTIKLIMNSESSKDRVATKGSIKIFNRQLPAYAKVPKRIQTASSNSNFRRQPNPQAHYNTGMGNRNQRTPNAQQQWPDLPHSSHWAGNRFNASSRPPLLPTPPGLAAWQNQFHDTEITIFLQADGVICEKISSVLENPEVFAANYNEILTEKGYCTVHIPDSILNSSKHIYYNKNINSVNQTQSNFMGTQKFHEPTMCQNPLQNPPSHIQSSHPIPNPGPSSNTDPGHATSSPQTLTTEPASPPSPPHPPPPPQPTDLASIPLPPPPPQPPQLPHSPQAPLPSSDLSPSTPTSTVHSHLPQTPADSSHCLTAHSQTASQASPSISTPNTTTTITYSETTPKTTEVVFNTVFSTPITTTAPTSVHTQSDLTPLDNFSATYNSTPTNAEGSPNTTHPPTKTVPSGTTPSDTDSYTSESHTPSTPKNKKSYTFRALKKQFYGK